MSALRLRRLVPRFSLRTLVVFMLLVTSGMGLWWHWEAWYCACRFDALAFAEGASVGSSQETPSVVVAWSADGSKVEVRVHYTGQVPHWYRIDATSGKCVETSVGYSEDPTPRRRATACGGRIIWTKNPGELSEIGILSVRDATSGETLVVLDDDYFLPYHSAHFSPDGSAILDWDIRGKHSCTVYARRRPEWWWGVFWLWEFWLTAAFAGLFVWSVVRDRRALGARASD